MNIRPFSVVTGDDKATLVLGASADLEYLLIAGDDGILRRIKAEGAQLGGLFFDTTELAWSNIFTRKSGDH